MYVGDAAAIVQALDGIYHRRVHMVMTSPPYFNLRDYGTATWEGGDPHCDHDVKRQFGPSDNKGNFAGQSRNAAKSERLNRQVCARCGARRVDLQIGSEDTIDAYLARLCDLFDLIGHTLLREDGSLWVNLGDSYAGSGGAGGDYLEGGSREGQPRWKPPQSDFPAKCLQMIPERFALAMIARGWILRNKCIWFKGKDDEDEHPAGQASLFEPLPDEPKAPPSNGMPSSAPDRLKNTWEYVFHFTRQGHYFYDLDNIREPLKHPDAADGTRFFWGVNKHDGYGPRTYSGNAYEGANPLGRNPGDLWFIPTRGFPLAHYATYPPRLVHIPAGATLPRAVCKACGAPVVMEMEPTGAKTKREPAWVPNNDPTKVDSSGWAPANRPTGNRRPTCSCHAGYKGAICLDPFGGSGATAQGVMEAVKAFTFEGCMFEPKTIPIDLDPRNVKITRKRLTGQARQSKRMDKRQFGGRDLLDLTGEWE